MTRTIRLSREELEPFLIEFPTESAVVDLSKVFGNDRPLEIEVGSGKGLFLLNSAQAAPNTNFLGIEFDRKWQLFAATRMAKRSLHNVRMASGRRSYSRAVLWPACCTRLHVYFPDPWWKRRHRKRRLFNPAFVQSCLRVLVPGGQLSIATDVEEYFKVIVKLIAAESRFTGHELPPVANEGFATNFDAKPSSKGRVFTGRFTKNCRSARKRFQGRQSLVNLRRRVVVNSPQPQKPTTSFKPKPLRKVERVHIPVPGVNGVPGQMRREFACAVPRQPDGNGGHTLIQAARIPKAP